MEGPVPRKEGTLTYTLLHTTCTTMHDTKLRVCAAAAAAAAAAAMTLPFGILSCTVRRERERERQREPEEEGKGSFVWEGEIYEYWS